MEFVIYIVIATVAAVLGTLLVKEKRKNLSLSKDIVQLLFDNDELLIKLSKVLDQIEAKPLEESEGFVKFISQSRDWAFSYIEETQATISKFIDDLQMQIDALKSYKGTSKTVYGNMVSEVESMLNELKEILPKGE